MDILDDAVVTLNAEDPFFKSSTPLDPALETIIQFGEENIKSNDDVEQLRAELKKHIGSIDRTQFSQIVMYNTSDDTVPEFVDNDSSLSASIIISWELLILIFCNDYEVMAEFINQLEDIPPTATIDIFFDVHTQYVDVITLNAGPFISNLIKRKPNLKIFNLGNTVSLPQLMMAMCCDRIFVSDFGSVSITKADNGDFLHKYILPVYQSLVKTTYAYWVNMGLFNQEEIDALFVSEIDNNIFLDSDEIKQRLKSKLILPKKHEDQSE